LNKVGGELVRVVAVIEPGVTVVKALSVAVVVVVEAGGELVVVMVVFTTSAADAAST
jgi:hypothetical protein